jgi:hypothetical protein
MSAFCLFAAFDGAASDQVCANVEAARQHGCWTAWRGLIGRAHHQEHRLHGAFGVLLRSSP